MSAVITKLALKKTANKAGNTLQTKVRGAPVWQWALGVSLAALTVYGTVRVIRSKIASTEDSRSFGTDEHSTWAKQLKNAMDGPGTNEVQIRKVLREIPSQQDWKKVKKSFGKLSKGGNLVTRMTSELSLTEFNEMLSIIQSKPEKAKDAGAVIYDPHGWAKRINAAINYNTWGFLWGTDEDALTAVVMDIPTIQAFMDTAEVYKEEYGIPIMQDINGDLSPAEILVYRQMILQKPRE